jgi:apolipoprotein N-acyltransferase
VRVPEVLLSYALLLFLFAYFFALNANMDYVQRFIESGGNLRLAIDTTTERRLVFFRYVPYVVVDALVYVYFRLRHYRVIAGAERRARVLTRFGRLGSRGAAVSRGASGARFAAAPGVGAKRDPIGDFARVWGLLLVYAAVFLTVVSYPSFMGLEGIAVVGWVSLVPLILVLRAQSYGRGIFFGVVYGVFTTLLVNYWLATFSLVSLQASVLIFFGFYLVFMVVALFFYHWTTRLQFLLLALAWTAFELGRSSGFLGYPWALVGHSQYDVLSLLQVASLTGVWGVSFLVVLVNSAIAHALPMDGRRRRAHPLFIAVALLGIALAGGQVALVQSGSPATTAGVTDRDADTGADTVVRIGLIQQNSDPRKHEYERTFDSLRRLSDLVLREDPDMVVWSETAFVPNIRRWSQEDPRRYRLARLVRSFLEYQAQMDTYLVTGNDDYRRVLDEEGEEIERLNFNAAVFFGPQGERLETYHKIRLVPFTEHFPYEETLPWVYDLLLEFDVNFWEQGDEKTVFEHPRFGFSTPICFEDIFPNEVRGFVRNGAEVIVNISNDYWSLTPVQAKQHFIGSVFRTVENRRPMVRATASGLTAHIDRWGRIHATAPYYEEAYLVADVNIPADDVTTVYTRFGDWFPLASAAAVLLMALLSLPHYVRLYNSPEAKARRRLERQRREFLQRKLAARRRRMRGKVKD